MRLNKGWNMVTTIVSPTPPPPEENYCQAYGGGDGWSWSLIDNMDLNFDEKDDNSFSFFHYQFGNVYGGVVERKYKTTTTAEFTAKGTYRNQKVIIVLKLLSTGLPYGSGYTTMDVLDETGERLLFLRLNSRYTQLHLA